jgi:hypothetical protein
MKAEIFTGNTSHPVCIIPLYMSHLAVQLMAASAQSLWSVHDPLM